jgi:hypothetical protein
MIQTAPEPKSPVFDSTKLGLKYFDNNEDNHAIVTLIKDIIPLFKGKSIHQIEQALTRSLEQFKAGYTIS